MFDYADEVIIHELVYLCLDCGEESPHSALDNDCCPYCESDDLEEL